jgi:hypothetical protein
MHCFLLVINEEVQIMIVMFLASKLNLADLVLMYNCFA